MQAPACADAGASGVASSEEMRRMTRSDMVTKRFIAGSFLTVLLLGPRWATAEEVDCSVPLRLYDLQYLTQGSCAREELQHECGCVTQPQVKKRIKPYYPASARRMKIAGMVLLSGLVDTD